MADMDALAQLQEHATSRVISLPVNARKLQADLRTILWKAHNVRKVLTSPKKIDELLKLIEPPSKIRKQLVQQQLHKGSYCIVVGDEKNQERNPELPHIKRDDGAWFVAAVRRLSPHPFASRDDSRLRRRYRFSH